MCSATNSVAFKHTVSGRLDISLSCIAEAEQAEGTEMLQILHPWVPDFMSGQLPRTQIYAPGRSVGQEMSNRLMWSGPCDKSKEL